jgi:carboxyl-terminal processing protease
MKNASKLKSVRKFWYIGCGLTLIFSLAWSTNSRLRGEESAAKPTTEESAAPEKVRTAEEEKEYYELLRLFADTLDQVERNYVKDMSRRELMEAAIRGMLTKLDQHSNYIPREEMDRFKTEVESEFGGVGIQVSIERGQLHVISPIYGSPAYRAGILAGDTIIKIEDKPTRGLTIDDCIKLLKGKVGTSVNVTVKHLKDDAEEVVKLDRETIRVDTVLGDTRLDDDTWNYYLDQEQKIAYIRITSFGRHTTEDLRKALQKLKKSGIEGLILDLRFNPGGLLSSAIEVSDLFISEGTIVSTEGRNTAKRSWTARKSGTFSGFPMAILLNRYSASASEIVSACLQDHDRAVVIGERSWGKGSVQNIIQLEEGKSALKLTTAGYMRPSGKNIHRFESASDSDEWGVRPSDGFELRLSDVQLAEVVSTRRERDILKKYLNGDERPQLKDPQLAKAVEYITAKLKKDEKKSDDEEKPAEKVEAEKAAEEVGASS